MSTLTKLRRARLDRSHWGQKILNAEQRGRFTDEEEMRAIDWVTCACGRVTHDIPRDTNGAPLNGELARLGVAFSDAVAERDFSEAASLLIQIEALAVKVSKGGA